ncbi:hypothetical protein A3Q56_08124 [Intoshia linei]|uniref:Uncharacterized protein n=1 Tax=Intoshia linei TaxID=1819745 RepID=A0A177AQ72_9BILA|nr:hypothetical protein A3Q56_08124 [Intoshia linei]
MKEAKNSLHKTSDFGVSNFLIQNKLSSNENTNVASFGTIQVYETGLCQFSLYNSGNYTIEFSWKFQKFNSDMVNVFLNKNRKHATNIHDNYRKSVNYEISNELNEQFHIHTDVSVVPTNYTANITIEWKPTKKYNLEGTFINFFIINGPQYKIALMGRSMKPAIQFSFTNYDFGPCLIKSNPSKCNLIMSNTDTRIVSLSHRWENDQSTSDEMNLQDEIF